MNDVFFLPLAIIVAAIFVIYMLPIVIVRFLLHYRLDYLFGRAKGKQRAGDNENAHRILEKVLKGSDGRHGTSAERVKRLYAEYSLAYVKLRLNRYSEALKIIDDTDAWFKPYAYTWSRAYAAYLRSYAYSGLRDYTSAQRQRQTAISLFKEYGATKELADLQKSAAIEAAANTHQTLVPKLTELYDLTQDGRSVQALSNAEGLLRESSLTDESRSYTEEIAGYHARLLGDLPTARQYYQAALGENERIGKIGRQALNQMELALIETMNGNSAGADALIAQANQTVLGEKSGAGIAFFQGAFLNNYYVERFSVADAIIDQIETLIDDGSDAASQTATRRFVALNRICLLTESGATRELATQATRLLASVDLISDMPLIHSLFKVSIEAWISAVQGKHEAFLHLLDETDKACETFLASRSPGDEANLRGLYTILIEACLAAKDFKRASHYIERAQGLPYLPCYRTRFSRWRERCGISDVAPPSLP